MCPCPHSPRPHLRSTSVVCGYAHSESPVHLTVQSVMSSRPAISEIPTCSSSAGSRQGRKRSSSSGADGSQGLVLAGEQYISLLDLRYRMRVLQRQLLGGAGEVEVPRGSPHFDIIQVRAGGC